jgi:hypothetical protein
MTMIHLRQNHSKEYLVFNFMRFLFGQLVLVEFSSERQQKQILLGLLDENTLNTWKMTITALPPRRDTSLLLFFLMLLEAHKFAKVKVPMSFVL